MPNVPVTANQFDAGVYQIETNDPVVGGAAGISNKQAIALANRTAFLKAAIDAVIAGEGGIPDNADPTLLYAAIQAAVAAGSTPLPSVITQAAAEAGVSTIARMWTAERVAQAIAALGGSKIVQVLSVISDSVTTTTASATLVGTGISQAITLAKSTNKVLAIVTTQFGCSSISQINASLLRDAVDLTPALATGMKGDIIANNISQGVNEVVAMFDFNYLDTPSGVGPFTYQISWSTLTGILQLNKRALAGGLSGTTTLTLMEIAA